MASFGIDWDSKCLPCTKEGVDFVIERSKEVNSNMIDFIAQYGRDVCELLTCGHRSNGKGRKC